MSQSRAVSSPAPKEAQHERTFAMGRSRERSARVALLPPYFSRADSPSALAQPPARRMMRYREMTSFPIRRSRRRARSRSMRQWPLSGHGWRRWATTVAAGTPMPASTSCSGVSTTPAPTASCPEFQRLVVGDTVPDGPEGTARFTVAAITPGRLLALHDPDGTHIPHTNFSWTSCCARSMRTLRG